MQYITKTTNITFTQHNQIPFQWCEEIIEKPLGSEN